MIIKEQNHFVWVESYLYGKSTGKVYKEKLLKYIKIKL